MCVYIHVRTAMNEDRQREEKMAITQDTLERIKNVRRTLRSLKW